MYPAKAVGGDLNDFIRIPNEKLGIVVGDVSGKGVSAGLFMPAVKIGLRVNVDHAASIVEIMARANRAIYELTDEERFVSLFLRIRHRDVCAMRTRGTSHPNKVTNPTRDPRERLPPVSDAARTPPH